MVNLAVKRGVVRCSRLIAHVCCVDIAQSDGFRNTNVLVVVVVTFKSKRKLKLCESIRSSPQTHRKTFGEMAHTHTNAQS